MRSNSRRNRYLPLLAWDFHALERRKKRNGGERLQCRTHESYVFWETSPEESGLLFTSSRTLEQNKETLVLFWHEVRTC